jgi:hypothetical protein
MYATGNALTLDLDRSSINVGATISIMGLEVSSNAPLDPSSLK